LDFFIIPHPFSNSTIFEENKSYHHLGLLIFIERWIKLKKMIKRLKNFSFGKGL